MLRRLAIAGYRSLRTIDIALGALTVVTGANGSGKSSLYRALRLLVDVAQGRVVQSLAAEGGLSSTLWAGPERFSRGMIKGEQPVQGTTRKEPVSLRLGFGGDEYGYAIDLGLPIPSARTVFGHDAQIKAEAMWTGEVIGRANVFAQRTGRAARRRNDSGRWVDLDTILSPFDSMMTECSDPREAAELLTLRDAMRSWRFYDLFRTDRDAPMRRAQVGTHTPVLASDGADLAAAVQTIREIGDWEDFCEAIDGAFPGAAIDVAITDDGFTLEMKQPGLLRPLRAAELSEGTLRFILLATALTTPRPPPMMVLNEPESSLHPDLLPALAKLIARAARHSQVLVVSHAEGLIAHMRAEADITRVTLEKRLGETIATQDQDEDRPVWRWPER